MTSKRTTFFKARFPESSSCTIAVIGLGYVGLPLAVELGKAKKCLETGETLKRRVIGFDINQKRLVELNKGIDITNETSILDLRAATFLEFTSDPEVLKSANVFIVTVPTPIDSAKKPDFTPLKEASKTVGKALKVRSENLKESDENLNPLIIYESTVYPGATEEICVPILEKESKLKFNKDFFCGYSPERINPGDTVHKLTTITKVTSGSNPQAAEWVDKFYRSIIKAGTHLAPSIKVAEAAKVIENTQRDLNIALVNELAIIFQKLGIDTLDVLEAAGTKWNFLPFRPGLVGGHCISVDPYYLTHKAEQVGYTPQVVLSGRRINDSMGNWVVQQMVLEMAKRGFNLSTSKVLVLGLSFKENCPDIRNTRVVDVIEALFHYGMKAVVVDPLVSIKEAKVCYGIDVQKSLPESTKFHAIIAAVAHQEFKSLSQNKWKNLLLEKGILIDLKGITPRELNPIRL
ncbi:nucleotide sugar dehydrogenase [Prochlorococcus sp. MIT 1341]|uniref:nucleotide sugar dehydrogenase n=1 Tax=Prochlorococcus sp. MIT 1341 TaxID=3096221 RepID=UPI002A75AD4D|nr:nucleotide sugar dehydrogenase [Prochlorococcus sp. MIT 1341]